MEVKFKKVYSRRRRRLQNLCTPRDVGDSAGWDGERGGMEGDATEGQSERHGPSIILRRGTEQMARGSEQIVALIGGVAPEGRRDHRAFIFGGKL